MEKTCVVIKVFGKPVETISSKVNLLKALVSTTKAVSR